MPKLTTQTRLRKALRKVSAPQTGWLDVFDAIVGRADGTVRTSVPGVIYVRDVLNGQVLAVYNTTGPLRATTQVEVGRRVDMPGLWQVKGVKEIFSSSPAEGDEVGFHHPQHEFPGGADIVWMDRKQIKQLTVLVKDAAAFIVQVYGGMAGNIMVDSQPVDISSFVVTAGAKFIGIETDEDGVLSIHEGDPFDAPALAIKDDLPVPGSGKHTIAWVLMYDGQVLANEDVLVPMPTFFNPVDYLTGVNWGDIGGTLSEQTDLQAVLDAKADADHAHPSTGGGEVVMEDGVTFPPVPVTTEEGDDWIYSA